MAQSTPLARLLHTEDGQRLGLESAGALLNPASLFSAGPDTICCMRAGLRPRVMHSWPVRLIAKYGTDNAGNYAAGLAFNAFTTMFPLLLGTITVVGLLAGGSGGGHRSDFLESLLGTFPSQARGQLLQALSGARRQAGLLGLASLAGLLWTGSNLFGSLEFALSRVYACDRRGFLRRRLEGLLLVLAVVPLELTAIGVTTGMQFLTPRSVLHDPWSRLVVSFIAGWLTLTVLLALTYWVVPQRSKRGNEVWPGALAGGLMAEAFTFVFPIYAKLVHGFNTYGTEFGLFLLLAFWLYMLAQLVLMGAEINTTPWHASVDHQQAVRLG